MAVGFGLSNSFASFFIGKVIVLAFSNSPPHFSLQVSDRVGRTCTLALGAFCQGSIMVLLFVEKRKSLTYQSTGDVVQPPAYATTWLAPCDSHTFNSHDTTADLLLFVSGNHQCACTIDAGQSGAGSPWVPNARASSHPDLTCECGACTEGQWGYLIMCAVLWGVGDAVWNTQISALLGAGWPDAKEDVFGNFKMWQSLAAAAAFVYSPFVGLVGQLAIVMGFLCLSIPW